MSADPGQRGRWAVALIAAALMSGCVVAPQPGQPGAPVAVPSTAVPGGPPVALQSAELVAFKAVLSASAEVPPADSAARGELVAVFNRNTNLLRWKLFFRGLSGPVRGAHFHGPAADGQVARPALPVGGHSIRSPYEGRAQLSAAQCNALLAGQWYVNLRTARFPEGELRGQLIVQQ